MVNLAELYYFFFLTCFLSQLFATSRFGGTYSSRLHYLTRDPAAKCITCNSILHWDSGEVPGGGDWLGCPLAQSGWMVLPRDWLTSAPLVYHVLPWTLQDRCHCSTTLQDWEYCGQKAEEPALGAPPLGAPSSISPICCLYLWSSGVRNCCERANGGESRAHRQGSRRTLRIQW